MIKTNVVSLDSLMDVVYEKMNGDNEYKVRKHIQNPELQKLADREHDLKTLATEGLPAARDYIKNRISFLLSGMKDEINPETIDGVIREYPIDYYKNIYTGEDVKASQGRMDENRNKNIDEEIAAYFTKYAINIYDGFHEKLSKLAQIIYQELYGYSILDELVFDGIFNEVAANRYDYLWIQYKGIKRRIPNPRFAFPDKEYYSKIIEDRITATASTEMNAGEPIVYSTLRNGYRVTAARPPLAKHHTVSIRLFTYRQMSDEDSFSTINLRKNKPTRFLPEKAEKIIELLIKKGRRSVAVIGEMGAGKTTTATEVVIKNLDDNLSIGIAENVHELNTSDNFKNKNVIEFQYGSSYSPTEIIEMFFRFNRDIVILGEVRNCNEAFEMIKAMLRQAKASLFTFHSSSVRRMVHDLRQLLMQTGYYTDYREACFDVADAIDLVLHIKLDRNTGQRYVYKLSEINAHDDFTYEIRDLFVYDKEYHRYLINQDGISREQIASCMEYEMTGTDVEVLMSLFVISSDEKELYEYMEAGD